MRSSSSPVSIAPSPASAGLPKPERTRAMAAISLAVCIATLDTSIVNTTLATIAAQLNASQADIIWIVTAYQLTMIAAMLPLASLGEKLGYRPVFLSGLALFTASSLACGLSPSFSALVAARALQGLGAAAVMSANTALVRSIYPEQILGRGLGINAFMNAFGLAAALAYALILRQRGHPAPCSPSTFSQPCLFTLHARRHLRLYHAGTRACRAHGRYSQRHSTFSGKKIWYLVSKHIATWPDRVL